MAEQNTLPTSHSQQAKTNQPETVNPSTPNNQNTTKQTSQNKPLISSTALFIGGIFAACILVVFGIFYIKNALLTVPYPSSHTKYTNGEESTTSHSQNTLPVASEWKKYTSSAYTYSFQYPGDYNLETDGKGTHLLEKVTLLDTKHSSPVLKLIVWERPAEGIEKDTVEDWCSKTLGDEARSEKLLCPFMSSAALDDTDIDNHPAFTMNYYNSDSERIKFYIVPFQSKIITIYATSYLDSAKHDDGSSQIKKILDTVSFN